jgi:glucosamine-6-phosphate deaminase
VLPDVAHASLIRDAPAPLVLADPRRVGLVAAELLVNRLSARPAARLLLPTGRSPKIMYAALRAHAADGSLPSSRATVLQLDEYVGLGPADPRSYAAQLHDELRGVPLDSIQTIDGSATDLAAEAARHDALLEAAPIDVAVLGLGRDGHVAFDEPPARRASGVRLVDLVTATRRDAAPSFGGEARVPARALTTGLGTLYRARELLLLVIGSAKAPALRAMLQEPVGPGSPASLLRDHPRLTVICDREAASLLDDRPEWSSDRVAVVLGHREPGISPEHRISSESRARLRHASRLAQNTPIRAVILTGYTSTGGLSEAEQMKTAWNERQAPALLEEAGRDTAENASRSLPILLALGEARRIVVISSAWHIRVPWFFAPYRHLGLYVEYRPTFTDGSWPRMLAHELRQARRVRRQRRSAMTAMRPPPEDLPL